MVMSERGGVADHAAGFSASQFEQVAIHFLRHGAAAGGVSLGQMQETVFLRRKQEHLFRPAAQVQGEKRKRVDKFQDEIAVAGGVDAVGGWSCEAELAGHVLAVERQG